MSERLSITLLNRQQAWAAIKRDVFPFLAAVLQADRRWLLTLEMETRTHRQNRLLHALFNDVARQAQWMGAARTPAQWKLIFVSGHAVATKQAAEIVPGIEGEFLNLRESTARMGKARMASLLEYVMAWAAQNGIELQEAKQWEEAAAPPE